ncbi:unnamed protein product, partial [Thelazia callipaeda]|uniref:Cysteine-rich membrane protein 2 n=1 Tax=Thelazia callipaeda TaxID=103827 RepID=A0A0N5CT97_THECL
MTPLKCSNTTTSYFNPVNFLCASCNLGAVASKDRLYCTCPLGFVLVSDGSCKKCEEGTNVSEDGQFCVQCATDGTNTAERCASCPSRYFMRKIISENGTMMEQSCAQCPNNTKVSQSGDTCIPCLQTDKNCDCHNDKMCKRIEINGISIIELESGSERRSKYIAMSIGNVVQNCLHGHSQACQHLANLCVLQNYRIQQLSTCTEFQKLFPSNAHK